MATLITPRPLPAPALILYPETDGQPMAESDVHARYMIDVRVALEQHFADQADVYVSGNLFLYYEEGDPGQVVAPDVFVVRGVAKRQRPIYKLWEEGVMPQFILEITSRSTRKHDLGVKRGLYAMLGVQEYFLFDPLGDYLAPRLQGFRLEEGSYTALTPDAQGDLTSASLGLELRLRDGELRFYDARAGRWLPTPGELAAALRDEAARRELAEQRAAAAETKLVRLREQLARRSGQADVEAGDQA
jgi:Uma2 family endonuclease